MPANQFKKHYQQLMKTFQLHFKGTLKNQAVEDIHQMRVTIKKLRAAWSLMALTTEGEWDKKSHYKHISKLFKAAGIVRELQINLIIANKFDVRYLDLYRSHQNKLLDKSKKKLAPTARGFNHRKLKELNQSFNQELRKISDEMILDKSIDFILYKIKKVRTLRSQLPNNRKLHKIRIQLKAVSGILGVMTDLKLSKKIIVIHKKIKSLNQQIGDWHDDVIYIESLGQYLKVTDKKYRNRFFREFVKRRKAHKKEQEGKIKQRLYQTFTKEFIQQIKSLNK